MSKKMLIGMIISFVVLFNTFSADQPKVDIPKNENADKISKDAEKAKKLTDKFKKKKEELPAPKGPVVAFMPFNYTYVVGEANGAIAQNEVVIAMVKSQAFTPASLKQWADRRFKEGEGKDIQNILSSMRLYKVPADYVCYGYVFKSGKEFGLKVALYPVANDLYASYYFRTFQKITDLPNVATQIMEEMKIRAFIQKTSLTGKKILINNFDLNYLIYSKSETGEVNISPLPFIKLEGMEYKKEDFFSELMLYNFHISRIFNAYNNNIKDYTLNSKYKPTINYDYTINTSLNLSLDIKQITIEVLNNKNEQVFSKVYRFEKLNLSEFYSEMRKWVKDITITLLSDTELAKAGEIMLNGLYSNEDVFVNEYYVGRGMQKDLIVPVATNKVKYWYGETALTGQFLKPSSYIEKYINVLPYKSGISKAQEKIFKMSVGANLIGGLYFHPQFNTQQKVIFHDNVGTKGYAYFNMGDILNSTAIDNKFFDLPTFLVGVGADLSMESKYIMLTNQLNLKFGYFANRISVEPKNDININSTPISNLKMTYELTKFNFALDYSFLPSAMFFDADSPFRMYGGLGLFAQIWYSLYNEKIKGTGTLTTSGSPIDYVLDTGYENRQSILMILGIFPEIGTIIKYSRFNIKIGIAYYFDLYKTSIWSNSEFGSFDKFNTGYLVAKVGFGYYL